MRKKNIFCSHVNTCKKQSLIGRSILFVFVFLIHSLLYVLFFSIFCFPLPIDIYLCCACCECRCCAKTMFLASVRSSQFELYHFLCTYIHLFLASIYFAWGFFFLFLFYYILSLLLFTIIDHGRRSSSSKQQSNWEKKIILRLFYCFDYFV